MTNAIGNDISKWQVVFDPDKASGPVDFSIMKMTEGTTEYTTPAIVSGWVKVGIRGGYHYQRSGVSWQAQADKFLQVASRYDTHFLAVDLEDALNTVDAKMYQETKLIIDYLRVVQSRPVLLYTNKNHYQLMQAVIGKAWMDACLFWYSNPTGIPGSMPMPTGRTTWTIHQYSWTGTPSRWGTGGDTDENIYNGTLEQMRAWLGVEVPPGYSKSRQYNSDVYTLSLPTWARAHVTNTNGTRETVSSAAQRLKATYAVNGDGWAGNAPLSLAASDGNLYNSFQYEFRPFVNIGQDNKVTINHVPMAAPYNLASGTRYLVRDGVNQFNTSADPEHVTERHPRTAIGHTKTNGLVIVVVDGRRPDSAGVTVKELAEIMRGAGVWCAVEMDGGGSSAMWVRGGIANIPSDGAERPVINHVLIYEEQTPMADYYEYTTTVPRRVRSGAGVQFPYILPDFAAGKAEGGATPGDRYTLPADVYNSANVLIGRKGDVWAKLNKVNGVAREGWTALVHLGTNQGITERLVTVAPPPPVAETVDVQLPAGSVVIFRDATGKEIARYTA